MTVKVCFFAYLALGGISDQPFRVCERHVARCRPISLVVGDDFHFSMLPHAHTRVSGTQIYTDGWYFTHFSKWFNKWKRKWKKRFVITQLGGELKTKQKKILNGRVLTVELSKKTYPKQNTRYLYFWPPLLSAR